MSSTKQGRIAATLLSSCLTLLLGGGTLAQEYEVSPTEYHFAEVEIGTSSTVIVSITYTGVGLDQISFIDFLGSGSPDFSVSVPGTVPLLIDGSTIGAIAEMGGIAYFQANDDSGPELWRSDGSADGTSMVVDICPDPFPDRHVRFMATMNDTLFFTADDGVYGPELWKTDGSEAGTVRLSDTYPGPQTGSEPWDLTPFAGALFFLATDDSPGTELWRSDGTVEGTSLFLDITEPENSRIHGLTVLGETMYFAVNLVGNHYWELWKTDGTTTGTGRVSDTQFGGIAGNYNVKVGDAVFFTASHRDFGQELWKSDTAGTALVKDIFPGEYEPGRQNSARPFGLIPFDDKLFFHADDGIRGRELWTSDGTEEGTELFLEINPGEGDGICGWNPFGFVFNGRLFFAADDGLTGCELWTSDGTVAGTWMVAELVPGPDGLDPVHYVEAGGTLFFTAEDPDHGRELWTSDGTPAGTTMVKDIRPGVGWSYIKNMTDVGGTLFFGATDGLSGYELWQSDGTEAGTLMAKEINPGKGLNINLEVTFAPTVPGPAEATLYVDHLISYVPFTGVGVEVVPPPDEQIAEVLEFIEDSVALGTLSGDGPGQSAAGRLNALINMIEAAGRLFAGDQLDDACRQLRDAYERCDGEPQPPDFVAGEAAGELEEMILAVIAAQGCVE